MKPVIQGPISLKSKNAPDWEQAFFQEREKFAAETLRASRLHDECERLRAQLSRASTATPAATQPTVETRLRGALEMARTLLVELESYEPSGTSISVIDAALSYRPVEAECRASSGEGAK